MPLGEAIDLLKQKVAQLTQKRIEEELGGVIPADHLPGLEYLIRASVSRVIQRLETIPIKGKGTMKKK